MKGKIARHVSMFLINHILCGTRFYTCKRRLMRFAGYKVGKGTRIVGPLFCTGRLTIGQDCHLGRNLTINGNGSVQISDRCDIGPDVTFLTGGHAIGKAGRRAGKGESYTIKVGSGTWIGGRSTLLRSVTVGKGCVIAACACVVNNLEDNGEYGGVPAKLIRKLDNDAETDTQ